MGREISSLWKLIFTSQVRYCYIWIVFMPYSYNEFYAYLEDEFEKKNGLGMQATKPKNGMFMFLAHCSST